VVTVNGGQGCASGLLNSTSATIQTDGASLFSASPSGPWTPTLAVSLDGTGKGQALVQASNAAGIQNIWATLAGGGGLGGILGGGSGCAGQTPNAVLSEVGTATSITLQAPVPARLQTTVPATKAHVVALLGDSKSNPVPGDQVYVVRSGDPGNPVKMTDAGDGSYSADLAPASAPKSEQLVAVDISTNPNLTSAPQTLVSASSSADCSHLGLKFTPATLVADGQSSAAASATWFNGSAPASGEPVTFTGDPGLNITGASVSTDSGGVSTATVHSGYSVGTRKVTVTDPNSLNACSQTLTVANGTAGTKDSGQLSRFIYRAYNDVLHRVGEDAGVEYYGNFVNFGGSRGQVALSFTTTTEYLTNVVSGMYQKYLGRAGDAGGITYWVGQLENGGTTDEQLAALFIQSDEFYANHGNTDAGWIDGLYNVVLGRNADAAGKTSWLNALNSGWSYTQVAYAFTGSTEQLSQKVAGFYQTLLHRAPNSAQDVSYWVGSIQGGVHDENVMAAFIGSQEYFDKS
jgi:hypothetical protein